MSTPAGWYDDGSGTARWWDGAGWTEHTMDAGAPAPATPGVYGLGQVFDPEQVLREVEAMAAQGVAVPAYSHTAQGLLAPGDAYVDFSAPPRSTAVAPVFAVAQPAPPLAPRSRLAVASLVLGVIGLGVIGVFVGRRALRRIEETGERGRGLAYAGLGVSWLTLGLLVIVIGVGGPSWFVGLRQSQDIAANAAITDATIAINTYWVAQKAYPASLADAGYTSASGVDVAYGLGSDGADYCLQATAGLTTVHSTAAVASAPGDCAASSIAVTPAGATTPAVPEASPSGGPAAS